jgi:hypothetical protein
MQPWSLTQKPSSKPDWSKSFWLRRSSYGWSYSPAAGVAWPLTPEMTAMFIGAGFIVRTYIGYFLWREKYWYRVRWQMW